MPRSWKQQIRAARGTASIIAADARIAEASVADHVELLAQDHVCRVSCKIPNDQPCSDTVAVGEQPPHYGIDLTWIACIRNLEAAEGLGPHNEVALHWKETEMARNKIVFIAFAIEDERARNLLKGQSLNTLSPFEYTDMSVKQAYDRDWKERVRTRIRRSDGVIVTVSKNSLSSSGQKWEIQCAKEERKRMLGIWVNKDDRTNIVGVNTKVWTWPNITTFINSL